MRVVLYAVIILLFPFISAHATIAIEAPLVDIAQEERAHALFKQVKCVVCTGESLADSQAGLAFDMRRYIRKQVAEGKSNQEILDALVVSYGESILMTPPVASYTYILWFSPVLIVLIGMILVVLYVRYTQKKR